MRRTTFRVIITRANHRSLLTCNLLTLLFRASLLELGFLLGSGGSRIALAGTAALSTCADRVLGICALGRGGSTVALAGTTASSTGRGSASSCLAGGGGGTVLSRTATSAGAVCGLGLCDLGALFLSRTAAAASRRGLLGSRSLVWFGRTATAAFRGFSFGIGRGHGVCGYAVVGGEGGFA